MKHIKDFNDYLNENKDTIIDPLVKKEAIIRLSGFFKVSPQSLERFKFDGSDNIK